MQMMLSIQSKPTDSSALPVDPQAVAHQLLTCQLLQPHAIAHPSDISRLLMQITDPITTIHPLLPLLGHLQAAHPRAINPSVVSIHVAANRETGSIEIWTCPC